MVDWSGSSPTFGTSRSSSPGSRSTSRRAEAGSSSSPRSPLSRVDLAAAGDGQDGTKVARVLDPCRIGLVCGEVGLHARVELPLLVLEVRQAGAGGRQNADGLLRVD